MTTENSLRKTNEQIIHDFLRLLAEKNLDAWIELWAEDAVQEMPFSPPGFPTKVEGQEALRKHYSNLPQAFGRVAFPDLVVHAMLDPDWVVAEYCGEIDVLATGRPCNNHYCGLFHLQAGRIALFREYYNPLVLNEAFGNASELAHSFSLTRS